MDRYIKWGLLGWGAFVIGFSFFLGCAKVAFQKIPNVDASCPPQSCISIDGFNIYDDVSTVGAGPVDIMIVDDNSPSMSTEQENLVSGHPFTNFISNMANMDYHIGIITTDVSASPNNPPRAINQFGALQDGNLIPFSSGDLWLSADTGSLTFQQQLFEENIARPETISCENQGSFNATNCPSGDERGIYALIDAVQRERSNSSGFFRENAPLHVIILSDEDERSTGGLPDDNGNPSPFPLEANDEPQTLVNLFEGGANPIYPQKELVVHSIIIRPGDTSCKSIQDAQHPALNVRGYYGNTYAALSNMTHGTIGNVCAGESGTAGNYTSEVGQIAVQAQGQVIGLACDPVDEKVDVAFNPPHPEIHPVVDGPHHRLTFDQIVPPFVQIERKYKCATD